MFRVTLCSSSGGPIVLIQHLPRNLTNGFDPKSQSLLCSQSKSLTQSAPSSYLLGSSTRRGPKVSLPKLLSNFCIDLTACAVVHSLLHFSIVKKHTHTHTHTQNMPCTVGVCVGGRVGAGGGRFRRTVNSNIFPINHSGLRTNFGLPNHRFIPNF